MGVRLRLTRLGCKHRPFYRIIAVDGKANRDGKHLEVLGFYNPMPPKDEDKEVSIKFDRVKYWLSVGAQPSDPVERLLFKAGLLSPRPMVVGKSEGQLVDSLTGVDWNADGGGSGAGGDDGSSAP